MYHSQVGQDQWVHSIVGDKKNGYFIELGACDGLYLSNTLFFEKHLQWKGICIEPNPSFHDDLERNRQCHKCHFCVSDVDDEEVDFGCNGPVSGMISTAGFFCRKQNIIRVKTKTLTAILRMYDAPKIIDYLSLDVEGHEFEILKNFPFEEYKIRCITVEHNEPHQGSELRIKIRRLLEANGYEFIKGNDDTQGWGHGPIDDFYLYPFLLSA